MPRPRFNKNNVQDPAILAKLLNEGFEGIPDAFARPIETAFPDFEASVEEAAEPSLQDVRANVGQVSEILNEAGVGTPDGAAPGQVTGVNVGGNNVDTLFVYWPTIDNNSPVTYEVYAHDVTGFTPAADTLIGTFVVPGEGEGVGLATVDVFPVGHLLAGLPVGAGIYYAVVRAVDGDGPGTYSTEASGTRADAPGDAIIGNLIIGGKIGAKTITGESLVANTVTTDKLAAGSVTTRNMAIQDYLDVETPMVQPANPPAEVARLHGMLFESGHEGVPAEHAHIVYRDSAGVMHPMTRPSTRMSRKGNQFIAGSTLTIITFGTGSLDWDDMGFRVGSSDDFFTLPHTGKYKVTGSILWNNNNAGNRAIHLRHYTAADALINVLGVRRMDAAGISSSLGQEITETFKGNAGDRVRMLGFQSQPGGGLSALGTAAGVETWLYLEFLRPPDEV